MTNLKHLELFRTNSNDISPLKNLTELEHLNVGDNKITNIDPLKNLSELRTLVLWNNNITELNSQNLTKLEILALSENKSKKYKAIRRFNTTSRTIYRG